ncbi:MAG: hypothetical protein KKA19_09995 [Candidatus Margulisbacteria bacterium]|nr:hypothetical protein [Candidatus Margulisiibacteriota bacterium]
MNLYKELVSFVFQNIQNDEKPTGLMIVLAAFESETELKRVIDLALISHNKDQKYNNITWDILLGLISKKDILSCYGSEAENVRNIIQNKLLTMAGIDQNYDAKLLNIIVERPDDDPFKAAAANALLPHYLQRNHIRDAKVLYLISKKPSQITEKYLAVMIEQFLGEDVPVPVYFLDNYFSSKQPAQESDRAFNILNSVLDKLAKYNEDELKTLKENNVAKYITILSKIYLGYIEKVKVLCNKAVDKGVKLNKYQQQIVRSDAFDYQGMLNILKLNPEDQKRKDLINKVLEENS